MQLETQGREIVNRIGFFLKVVPQRSNFYSTCRSLFTIHIITNSLKKSLSSRTARANKKEKQSLITKVIDTET